MSWGYRKSWQVGGLRITFSWRPVFHLPRLTLSMGGR